MALDRENKALPYLTGRAIAIVERHAQSHFGPGTLTTMFNTPEYSINVFCRYVPSEDSDWAEVAGTPFPKHLIPVEQSQAWVGYYHQKAELGRQEVRQKIGTQISEARERKGYSIRELAEKCGVSYVTISKIENGKFNVGLDVIARIASVLGLEVELVMKEI